MAGDEHTYGPSCRPRLSSQDESQMPNDTQDVPPVTAQFFYLSATTIDDPLSPLPPVTATRSENTPGRPFSQGDNEALEQAWQKISRANAINERPRPGSRGLNRMFSFPEFRSGLKESESISPPGESSTQGPYMTLPRRQRSTASVKGRAIKGQSLADSVGQLPAVRPTRKLSIRSNTSRNTLPPPIEQEGVPEHRSRTSTEITSPEHKGVQAISASTELPSRVRMSSASRAKRDAIELDEETEPKSDLELADKVPQASTSFQFMESDISGRPFARAPSSRRISTLPSKNISGSESSPDLPPTERPSLKPFSATEGPKWQPTLIPVGVSRLHIVDLPAMDMKPIYWSPVNDISTVIRATWFYKDSMQPVPAEVANRLEIGYEDMRPFSESYQDELDACVENGAAAELKIVHKLWPDEAKPSRPSTALEDKNVQHELSDASEEPLALPDAVTNAAADPRKSKKRKIFESHSVVYIGARHAQILRPSALPSVSRNRKPLQSIRKGREIGVAVVRGFDRAVWNKLHPQPGSDRRAVQAQFGAYMSQSGTAAIPGAVCAACEDETREPQVTDLVLVIHGIGQKLSERVDSYHFTHAINGLRREFNVELASESMKGSLKDGAGIMVLPVNWRLKVKFDEDQVVAENKYELKDITPETLPAVRSLISDVMLDIPYYMSHHKSKMTSAVIREANQVYRLWCKNNPGFEKNGRVHILAHSLGSVMAMEILSNQPTFVPEGLDLVKCKASERIFEFDTTNLFCCGSPAGFFLLLNNANLVPRKGRNKTGMEGEDQNKGVGAEAGQYGCPAVDNVYNICHRNDPIAYQQNACVDSEFATMLKPANIPSASQSLFGKIGNSFRWTGTSAQDAYGFVGSAARPVLFHMPSTVEMETHDFTREEIAEKRMSLLNDNGQIDYFLSSGGGPLEIQYLNMLSAHSSYWYLRDFVRFLVVEIGRQPGKQHTLPALRAVKKREYKKGALI